MLRRARNHCPRTGAAGYDVAVAVAATVIGVLIATCTAAAIAVVTSAAAPAATAMVTIRVRARRTMPPRQCSVPHPARLRIDAVSWG